MSDTPTPAQADEKALADDVAWWQSTGDMLNLDLRAWTQRTSARFVDRATDESVTLTGSIAGRLHALRPAVAPIAWTGQGSLVAIAEGRNGTIYPEPPSDEGIPLFASPPAPAGVKVKVKTSPAAQGTVAPEELAKQIADAASDMCEIARIADEWRHGPKQSLTAIREIRAWLSTSPSPEALPASGVEAVDAQTAFEARHRGLNLDRMEGHFTGYRDPHTDARWLGWKACWTRVEGLMHALDQMRGPLSTAALVARAEKAEAALTCAPAPEDRT
ncbi:hypothetical protein [Bosea vestrisii]|uniref:Uncharacterized protein n=1 Tax=Bosea vestrisii TaxID=151416 RepID=A0ABW0H8H1_9HYPH